MKISTYCIMLTVLSLGAFMLSSNVTGLSLNKISSIGSGEWNWIASTKKIGWLPEFWGLNVNDPEFEGSYNATRVIVVNGVNQVVSAQEYVMKNFWTASDQINGVNISLTPWPIGLIVDAGFCSTRSATCEFDGQGLKNAQLYVISNEPEDVLPAWKSLTGSHTFGYFTESFY